jgi:hypothetical protein
MGVGSRLGPSSSVAVRWGLGRQAGHQPGGSLLSKYEECGGTLFWSLDARIWANHDWSLGYDLVVV